MDRAGDAARAAVTECDHRISLTPTESSWHRLCSRRHLAKLLRTYRNLVHPFAEKRARYSGVFDTADLRWSTVNAVLDALAASNQRF